MSRSAGTDPTGFFTYLLTLMMACLSVCCLSLAVEAGSLPDRKLDGSGIRSGWMLDDFAQHDAARAAHLIREEVSTCRVHLPSAPS